jgi:SAM-dependent methyltransferase
MDNWRDSMPEKHPYEDNFVWQRNYAALNAWLAEQGLAENGRVIEIGCGTGLLQDLVPAYYGVDIAPSSAQFMHTPFAICSGTRLPFPDNSFDAAWSIWVLEHVKQPEEMLAEMRRIVKPGGSIFLVAAYGVDSWVSSGLHKRSLRELSVSEFLIRMTIPLRASRLYKAVFTLPCRLWNLLIFWYRRQPTKLIYGQLQPNYEIYWDYDADAVVSLDAFNVSLYFLSRGDRSLFTPNILQGLLLRSQPQAYLIHKPPNPPKTNQ